MTLKQEYQQFLSKDFNGLVIKENLFYNWNNGLRFELGIGDTNSDDYFKIAINRAVSIFQAAFDPDDNLFFVLIDYRFKRRKIRFNNFCFRQISNLSKSEIFHQKVKKLYEDDERMDIYNIAKIKLRTNRINYTNILSAICNTDFPPRKPRLDRKGFLSSKQIFFLNIDKKLIFHMYDDRGLDIISKDKETIRPIYERYNDWILEYDREKIESNMGKYL